MDKYEKLEALLDDAAVQQELAAVESVEAMQEVLKNHGVELTDEEIKQVVAVAENQDELSDADLENVAGGLIVPWWQTKVIAKLVVWIIKKKNKK